MPATHVGWTNYSHANSTARARRIPLTTRTQWRAIHTPACSTIAGGAVDASHSPDARASLVALSAAEIVAKLRWPTGIPSTSAKT